MLEGSENIGKILLISFNDNEEEIIESVLAALGTGRNIYCDENNIKPLKIHYGDIVILLDKRELFRKQEKIDLSFIEFEILHLLMRSPGRVFSKNKYMISYGMNLIPVIIMWLCDISVTLEKR